MANTITTVSSFSNFPPGLTIPPGYPTHPAPGKIELLLNSNSNFLYSKFSPYTNYDDNILGGILSDKQPFIYTTIQQGQTSWGSSLFGDIASLVNITPEATNDVTRVSKFLISSWGVQFLATQTALQRLAPFDETRIYNPLSPLLATIQPLTIGIGQPPLRHIESVGSGVLGTALGALNSITSTAGINLQNGYSKPPSTAGDDSSLPSTIQTGIVGSQGKGMIRGSDAVAGISSFQSKWQSSGNQDGNSISGMLTSAVNNFAGSIANSFMSFFGGAPKSPGIFRADEQGYRIMALRNDSNAQNSIVVVQPWFASSTNQIDQLGVTGTPQPSKNKSTFGIITSTGTSVSSDFAKSKLLSLPDTFTIIDTTDGLGGYNINDNTTGYDAGNKYNDVVGRVNGSDLTNSDMLVQYSYYIQPTNKYSTKITDTNSDTLKEIQNNLQAIITDIGVSGVYNATGTTISYLLNSGQDPTKIGYDNLFSTTPQNSYAAENTYGVIKEYQDDAEDSNVPSIDATVKSGQLGSNLRMATTFYSDGINTAGVLSGGPTILISSDNSSQVAQNYNGWTEWRPYKDDLIAFFFYDVVNDKYIPFRATIKTISEGGTAFWDELRFIGRSDQLYSYNGFSRTLSFAFNVVINSVIELLPSWKKINYIASSIKPSNYTHGQTTNNNQFNRFIVPPMFMLTVGDLYKFQPVVITSVNINIPDDASWETLNELNSKNWSYLNGLITAAPILGKNYGQLPREAEISITCNLLEKERAIVGGSNFGHEPRIDDWENTDIDSRFVTGSAPYLPVPTTLHKNFVVWNNSSNESNANVTT